MTELARLAGALDGNQWLLLAGLATVIAVTAIKTTPDIIRAIGDLIRARSATAGREDPPATPPAKPKGDARKRLWLVKSPLRRAEDEAGEGDV